MNLTDYATTSVQTVFDAVAREAAARGVGILESELIGLIPAAALAGTTPEHLKLTSFTRSQILEERIAQKVTALNSDL
jgi:glutamate formiminotransferase